MANWDHADNIGTHPAYSKDPETALRARLDAARIKMNRAHEEYVKARQNLHVFLTATAEPEPEPEPEPEVYTIRQIAGGWWASEPTTDPETAAWDYHDDRFSPRDRHGEARFTFARIAAAFLPKEVKTDA